MCSAVSDADQSIHTFGVCLTDGIFRFPTSRWRLKELQTSGVNYRVKPSDLGFLIPWNIRAEQVKCTERDLLGMTQFIFGGDGYL
jgi:hypothetical protein